MFNLSNGKFFSVYFLRNGESWKKQRTCLNGLFLKKGALSDYMGFFTNVIDDMIQGFENKLDNDNSLIIPELEKQLYSWSIECKYQNFLEKNIFPSLDHLLIIKKKHFINSKSLGYGHFW